jgi:hypothetical protein
VIFPDIVGLGAALARLQSAAVANDLTSRRPVRFFCRADVSAAALPRVAIVATRSGTERALRARRCHSLSRLAVPDTRSQARDWNTREPSCAQGATRATCSNCVVDAPSASSRSTERSAGAVPPGDALRDGLTGSDFDRKATRPAVGRSEIWLLRSDASNPPRPDYARRSRISWFRARLPCECRCFGSSLTASGHGRTRRGPR